MGFRQFLGLDDNENLEKDLAPDHKSDQSNPKQEKVIEEDKPYYSKKRWKTVKNRKRMARKSRRANRK